MGGERLRSNKGEKEGGGGRGDYSILFKRRLAPGSQIIATAVVWSRDRFRHSRKFFN